MLRPRVLAPLLSLLLCSRARKHERPPGAASSLFGLSLDPADHGLNPVKDRALIMIASHWSNPYRAEAVRMTLLRLGSWRIAVDVEVHTDSERSKLFIAQMVAADIADGKMPHMTLDIIVMPGLALQLTWQHRQRMSALVDEHGIDHWAFYAYLEDDMELTWLNFISWYHDIHGPMRPASEGGCGDYCSRSFVRFEHSTTGMKVIDLMKPMHVHSNQICHSQNRSFAIASPGYYGFWLATREEFARHLRSKCWALGSPADRAIFEKNETAKALAEKEILLDGPQPHNAALWFGEREVAAAGSLGCTPVRCVPILWLTEDVISVDPLATVAHHFPSTHWGKFYHVGLENAFILVNSSRANHEPPNISAAFRGTKCTPACQPHCASQCTSFHNQVAAYWRRKSLLARQRDPVQGSRF